MEGALLTRIYGIADPTEVGDQGYLEGLRNAASAAVGFGLDTIEASQDRLPLAPPALLSQARLAARSDVGLATVLRRYAAGHALLVDFIVEEVERGGGLPPAELRRLLAICSAAVDRLLAAVSEEHARELESRGSFTGERRLAERVERLLGGEPVDVEGLSYDFSGWHLGIVGQGKSAKEQLRALATELDCIGLFVPRDGMVWAWLGSREPLDPDQVLSFPGFHDGVVVAVGEPANEASGWRLTHRQATAALTVALRGDRCIVRYADAALVAAALDNEVLHASLGRLYLDPLAKERDGGETLRRTLDTYFRAGGNVTSVAAAMGVSRRTIRSRLHRVEQLIGRSRQSIAAELETAVRLHRLASSTGDTGSEH